MTNPVADNASKAPAHDAASSPERDLRKANIRLAIVLGVVALCFYFGMIFFNPLSRGG